VSIVDLDELLAVVVIVVLLAIVLWFIVRESEVLKLNINTELKMGNVPQHSIKAVNLAPFQLVWRGAEKIPFDWDNTLLDVILRREQRAFTVQFLGRKLTFIVDGRQQVIERGVVGSVLISFINLHAGTDFRSGHTNTESELSASGFQLSPDEKSSEPTGHRSE
jgi:hypothetical protein